MVPDYKGKQETLLPQHGDFTHKSQKVKLLNSSNYCYWWLLKPRNKNKK